MNSLSLTNQLPAFFPTPVKNETVEHACFIHRSRLLRARIMLLNAEVDFARQMLSEVLGGGRADDERARQIDAFRAAIQADERTITEVLKATRLEE